MHLLSKYPYATEILVLAAVFLGACFPSFPSFQSFALCRSLQEIHRVNVTVTPLGYISVQLLGIQQGTREAKEKGQLSRKLLMWWGRGKGPAGDGRMQLEIMSGALCTGEILAAGSEKIHFVVVGKPKFIISKQLPMANVAILSEMQCRSQRL